MKYFYLYRLTKEGEKEYLTYQATFKPTIQEDTYKTTHKAKALSVRGYVEKLKKQLLYLEKPD